MDEIATESRPKVAVSILNWNQPDLAAGCLEQVLGQSLTPDLVIVVDNASEPSGIPDISGYDSVELLHAPENLGYAGGHALAVDYALDKGFDLLWILNIDLQLNQDSLEYLVAAYENYGLGLYGSLPHSSAPIRAWPVTGGEIAFDTFVEVEQMEGQEVRVANIDGSSMLVPLEVVRQHGFMDARFFIYGEETDYCLRLAKRGVPSYFVKKSQIAHSSQGWTETSTSLDDVADYYRTRNHLHVTRKHQSTGRFLRLLWSMGRNEMGRSLRSGSFQRIRYQSLFDGCLGRLGKRFPPEIYK